MTLVILAAGMGSRYGGMKQIDPITEDGNFIIDFSVYDAIKAGFDKVVFIIKEENLDSFKETIGNRINKYIKTEYVFQDVSDLPAGFSAPAERTKPWGTTHAVLSSRFCVNEPFALINSDDFYGRESFEILADHLKRSYDSEKLQLCMAGYLLKNTLTENGSVNRGVCKVDADGKLCGIVEKKGIFKGEDGMAHYPENGVVADLDLDTIVSMNCWGFTPEIFKYMSEGFKKFLCNLKDPIKDECYLADVLDVMIKKNDCDISVYKTDSTWMGVTYADDKPAVVNGIKKLINDGVYPEHLWK